MLKHLRFLVLSAVVIGLALPASRVFGQSVPVADEFSALHFRSIGPASMSGRVTDLAVYEPNPAIYYVGHRARRRVENHQRRRAVRRAAAGRGHMSMGAVAVSQKDPNLVWAGGGESNNRQSSSWGDGVYKSTDGGGTWRNMGLRSVAPHQPHRDRPDRPQHRVCGGDWIAVGRRRRSRRLQDDRRRRNVEAGPERTERLDRRQRPRDVEDRPPHHVCVAVSAQRSQCCFNGGGPGSAHLQVHGLRRDVDASSRPIPSGNMGRIAVDVFRGSANLVYALIEAEAGVGASAADASPDRRRAAAGARWRPGRGAAAAPIAQAGRGGGRRTRRRLAVRARTVSIDPTTAARRGGG